MDGLRVDVEAGVWVVLATFSPGSMVPLHYHTGVAIGYAELPVKYAVFFG